MRMKLRSLVVAVALVSAEVALAGVNGVKLKTGAERPLSPLDPGLELVGRLRARSATEVGHSRQGDRARSVLQQPTFGVQSADLSEGR